MADPISWGLIDDLDSKVDIVKTDTERIKADTRKNVEAINGVSTKMDTLVSDVTQVVESAPSGVMAARMLWFASESVDSGIKISYKVNVGVSFDGRIPSKEDIYNYDLASVTKGVMVRYKAGGYPLNKNDGTLAFKDEDIFNINDRGELIPKEKNHTVTGLSNGTKYYFCAFPYSTYNVYNEQLGTSNCTTCTYSSNKGALRVSVGMSGYHTQPLGEYKVTINGVGGAFTQQGKGDSDFIFNSLTGGEYILTLSSVKGFTAPKDQTINVVAGQTKKITANYKQVLTLQTCTWEDVANVAASGQASKTFNVGETKTFRAGSEEITVEIVDFDHDDLPNGGKAPITFAMKHLLADRKQMNPTSTTVGSFKGSQLYGWLNNTLFPSLPSDLKSAIKTVNKKTSEGGGSYSIKTDTMKLFLFSEKEFFNTHIRSVDGEGYQYPYFATQSRRAKKFANGTAEAGLYYLRSPHGGGTDFCSVLVDGSLSMDSANHFCGVCFGFCI